MDNEIESFFSNRIELLYKELSAQLFRKNENPFRRKLIIVPSPAMKSYLMRSMAEDPRLSIAFGLEISYLNQGFDTIKRALCASKKRVPASLELSFALENEIRQILKQQEQAEKKLWAPLAQYCAKDKRKLASLSDELAYLFLQYGEYGGEGIQEWEQEGQGGWQGELWRRVFLEKACWTYPYTLLSETLENEGALHEVHLFGLSFLSHLKNQFLSRASKHIPIYYWLISPCEAFWSDIRTDKESSSLIHFWKGKGASPAKLSELESYLRDRNSLLANFGRMGRHMAEEIESLASACNSSYEAAGAALEHKDFEPLFPLSILPCKKEEPLTLLAALQADLVALRNPQEKIELGKEDCTIQVHSAPSRLREVEIVYQILLRTLTKSSNGIEPKDILIMAPEISDYAPYIEMVFGCREGKLDYQIMDLKNLSSGELIQSFNLLLDLPGSKWKAEKILKLFSSKLFQKKQGIEKEDITELKKWIETHGISWGLNQDNRNELLKSEGYESPLLENSNKGTWEEGLDQLLMGLALNLPENDEEKIKAGVTIPFEKIDLSLAELIGKLFQSLKSLEKDLRPLSNDEEKTLPDWSSYFSTLLDSYLLPAFHDAGLDEESKSLKSILNQLRKAGNELNEELYPAKSVLKRLKASFNAKEYTYKEKHFQAVRFSSLLPMRAVPAKVVLLMGLDEGAYPRSEVKSSLNLILNKGKSDYCPSQVDYDRYLFLEALLSAREQFILTYVSKNASNGKRGLPSLLISELLEYLDRSYTLGREKASEKILLHHPFHSFDKSYFEEESRFLSLSSRDYQLALSYYESKKEGPYAFLREFSIAPPFSIKVLQNLAVDLKELKLLAKNPIQYYFNKTLEIYLKEKAPQANYGLTALDKHLFKIKGLKLPLEEVIELANLEGALPLKPFKILAQKTIREEVEETLRALKRLDLNKDEIFEVAFSHAYAGPEKVSSSLWGMPPVQVNTIKGKIEIVGRIPFASSKGMISWKAESASEIIKNYPSYLLYLTLPDAPFLKQALFAGGKDPLPLPSENPYLLLEEYLEYYYLARAAISPLMPDWTEAFLEKDPEELIKRMAKSLDSRFQSYTDPYLEWALNKEILPDHNCLIEKWGGQAQKIYGPILGQRAKA